MDCVCSSTCSCCIKSANTIDGLKGEIGVLNAQLRAALEEINHFRKLLDMAPLQTIQVSSSSITTYTLKKRETVGLATLPPEILNHIVTLMDSKYIMPFCQAVPQLKHISQAIYDVGKAFKMKLNMIWPEFWFPVEWIEDDFYKSRFRPGNPIPISGKNLVSISKLTHLLSRYGGVAKVQMSTLDYLEHVMPLLPNVVDVYIQADNEGFLGYWNNDEDEYSKMLVLIQKRGITIRTMDVPTDDKYNPEETSKLLREARAQNVNHWRCTSLESFSFRVLLEFQNVERIDFQGIDPMMEAVYFDGLVDLLPQLKNLRYISFEDCDVDGTSLPALRRGYELKKIGWVEFWDKGVFFGYPSLVWKKGSSAKN
ncbi:hypothetical protein HDU79_006391 [Rhizoclosmatium sp. JEL0117]|nr:hypothetical protein HDU79_006391 [Rhizoclosmatium sp. JEL0117]